MKRSIALFCAILLTIAGGITLGGWQINNGGGGGPSNSTAANLKYWYLVPQSQGCGSMTNCTAIYGDTTFVIDGTSNSTTTFTFPNSDGPTSAQCPPNACTFWANTQGGGASQFELTTVVCPITTIASISGNSITLNAACTANGTANVMAIWGHNDGPTLHALDGNNTGCVTVLPFSAAYIMVDQAEFITPPNCATTTGSNQPLYSDRNWGAVVPNSAFIMTPNFQWSTCTGNGGSTGTTNNVCFGTGLGQINDLFIWGTGLTPASNANCANGSGKTIVSSQTNLGSFTGLNLAGICPGETGEGAELQSTDQFWQGGGAQFVMTKACVSSALTTFTQVLDCRNDTLPNAYGMTVAGGNWTDSASWPVVGLNIGGNATASTRGTHIWAGTNVSGSICGVTLAASSKWFSYGDFVGTDGVGTNAPQFCNSIGSITQIANTTINNIGTGPILQLSGGSIVSLGGNTLSGTHGWTTFNQATNFTGSDIVQGSCTGTVTSASTIGLYGAGNNTTTTCTSTTTNLGPTMGKAGTAVGLQCSAGTAGNQAADACTVMQNNVATSMTCSLNGATFCVDGTHTFSYALGDIITVKIVSGTATTLANVRASVLTW